MPKLVVGTEVDHRVPHNGDVRLFFDESNLQTLCKPHHSRKTMREQRATPAQSARPLSK